MRRIIMGNDEFILYIRKNYRNCSTVNSQLGKKIWIWITEHDANSKQIFEDQESEWGSDFDNNQGTGLPKTATQFEFNRDLLPDLYGYLDVLGDMQN